MNGERAMTVFIGLLNLCLGAALIAFYHDDVAMALGIVESGIGVSVLCQL